MSKYNVTFVVTAEQQLNPILTGTSITITIEAPHEQAAAHRASLLFTDNRLVRDGDGLLLTEVAEVLK